MKRNKHLSLDERSIIERLMQEGKSNKAIAEVLGRSKSTIGRELERNCWQEGCLRYQGKKAQGFSDRRGRFNIQMQPPVKVSGNGKNVAQGMQSPSIF